MPTLSLRHSPSFPMTMWVGMTGRSSGWRLGVQPAGVRKVCRRGMPGPRSHPKYDADTTRAEWQAIATSPSDRIGAGTMIYHADQIDVGWRKSVKGAGLILYADARSGRPRVHQEPVTMTPRPRPRTLRYYRGSSYHWRNGYYGWYRTTRICARSFTTFSTKRSPCARWSPSPFNPDKNKVDKVLDALRSIVAGRSLEAPSGRDPAPESMRIDVTEVIAVKNGLLNVATRKLHPHSPHLFIPHVCPSTMTPTHPATPVAG